MIEQTAEEILEQKILKKELKIYKLQRELTDLRNELQSQHKGQTKFKIKL